MVVVVGKGTAGVVRHFVEEKLDRAGGNYIRGIIMVQCSDMKDLKRKT